MKRPPLYKFLFNHNAEKSFHETPNMVMDFISALIIKNYKRMHIKNNDKKLYNIILRKEVSQEAFDNFIKDWDIEEEGGMKALLLSYFMKTHPELRYPEYIEPRLKGILQFYRFKNLKLISHFIRICNKLKSENIDIMIIKGGAIKHYRKDLPRIMGDIDIIVRNKDDYDKSKEIIKELGYTYKEYGHSLDIHEGNSLEGILDIHHGIHMVTDNESFFKQDLFKRAHLDEVFNIKDIYVPCIEDMMFLTLINLSQNLLKNTSYGSKLHSAIDCMFFTEYKQNFDWNIVIQNTQKTNTEAQIYLAIKYLNTILPTKLPELFKSDTKSSSIEFLYKIFLRVLKDKSHELSFKSAFKNIDELSYYLKFRPQYLLYKQKMIKQNTKLARYVLENQRLLV